jgi:Peptidase family M48
MVQPEPLSIAGLSKAAHSANPFSSPWLFSRRVLLREAMGIAQAEDQAAEKRSRYAMEPDPFSMTPDPNADPNNAPVAMTAPESNPAEPTSLEEKLFKSPELVKQAESIRQGVQHIATKYDVNKIGSRGIGSGMNFYSIEKEQMLGHELAVELEQHVKILSDPVITEYVNRIGQDLVRNSDARVPFVIKVVDDDEINAFALPGGFFYVNTGLILAADNEAELAGVMAHEIAHVAARHATKNITKKQIWDMASIPLIFVGGPAGMAVRQVTSLAVPMSFMKFSRDAEREADLLGMEYQYAAGYDPQAFIDFFEKLQVKDKHKSNFLAKAFATHPMTDDRIHRAEAELDTMLPAKDEYILTTSEFDRVKSRLTKVTLGHQIDAGNPATPTLRRRVQTPDDKPPVKEPSDKPPVKPPVDPPPVLHTPDKQN